MVKHKIFKYFLYEFFKIFFTISLLFSILIWMTQAARLLELITELGNPINIYSKYIFLRFPKIYEETFLISFLVSIFFLFSKFQNSNEINIYFLSGINKFQLYKICIFFSTILIILYLFLSIIISPSLSFKGRELLGKSEFNLINTLVKEKNFNSPLEGLTIFINKNDEKGNLEGIFIYEKNRTIIAKKGEVLSKNEDYYLKLINGITQEKVNENLNTIKFESTIFDFSKFSLRNTVYPKFSERDIFWIYSNMNNFDIKFEEIREEFSKRVIMPFSIFILCTLASFILISNSEKFNKNYFKYFIYTASFLYLFINQAIINISSNYLYGWAIYSLILILIFLFFLIILLRAFRNESTKT